MKMKIAVNSCYISVVGMDMTCPFCKVVVKSGESHECNPVPKKFPAKTRKKAKLSGAVPPAGKER